jgi:hypothetical protein
MSLNIDDGLHRDADGFIIEDNLDIFRVKEKNNNRKGAGQRANEEDNLSIKGNYHVENEEDISVIYSPSEPPRPQLNDVENRDYDDSHSFFFNEKRPVDASKNMSSMSMKSEVSMENGSNVIMLEHVLEKI